ncbi:MAG TPA: VWA domain-containing protein [Pyrinomonadaceae bacterium]
MRIRTYLCAAVVGLISLVPTLFAQPQVATSSQDDRIVVGTNLVTLNVIVTDNNGRYVKGLARDQFEVYDNKVKQQIVHFSADASPVSIGIISEIHANRPEKIRAMLGALKQFTNGLRERDDFFFVAFSEYGTLKSGFIPSANQILDHLQYVKPGGPTSLYDAVYLATERLRQGRNLKKALLIISDGQDDRSHHSYKELRDRLRTFDVQIYAIGIADPTTDRFAGYGRWVFEDLTRQTGRRSFLLNSEAALGRAVLEEMSRSSGGTTYFPDSENEPELSGICTQIGYELRQQYTLGFYAHDVDRKKWRRLKVRINKPDRASGLTLSYREAYQLAGN